MVQPTSRAGPFLSANPVQEACSQTHPMCVSLMSWSQVYWEDELTQHGVSAVGASWRPLNMRSFPLQTIKQKVPNSSWCPRPWSDEPGHCIGTDRYHHSLPWPDGRHTGAATSCPLSSLPWAVCLLCCVPLAERCKERVLD